MMAIIMADNNRQPAILTDVPTNPAMGWKGYYHKQDPTTLPQNVLTFPTINCSIPEFDRVVPRGGQKILGANYTITYNTLSGLFTVGETIIGATSGATAIVLTDDASSIMTVANVDGIFIAGETISNSNASSTAVVVSFVLNTVNSGMIGNRERFTNANGDEMEVRVRNSDDPNKKDIIEVLYRNPLTDVYQFWQITENNNPIPLGVHEYYFDEWFDTNLGGISLNLPRLVFVNGTNKIMSWTGGIAAIENITATTLILDPQYTWQGLGFIDPSNGGSGNIVINGVVYTALATSNWNSNILELASTAGISVNDLAFDQIQIDSISVPNQLTYSNLTGDFVVNETITGSVTGATAVIAKDDGEQLEIYNIVGSFDTTESITGATSGATADIDGFVPLNIKFDVCRQNKGYMEYGDWDSRNLYGSNAFNKVSSAQITTRNAFQDDLVVTNGNKYTANFLTQIRYEIDSVIPLPTTQAAVDSTSVSGDDLVYSFDRNPITRTVITVTIDAVGTPDTFEWFINGVSQASGVAITGGQQILLAAPPVDDGLYITFGHTTGHTVGDTWTFTYGGQDTYRWYLNGVLQQEFQPVNISLYDGQFPPSSGILGGVTMKTNSTYNHQIGDYWVVTLNPPVTRAWTNFYYSVPARKPGEGFVIRLPSNFWTMAPQEEDMYVNTAHGEWLYITTILSSDLQTEEVRATPLKQAMRNKVLYPYLLGYLDNDLIYITEDKQLNMIGRRQFLEKPQVGNLSDPVELDFQALSFLKGRIKFFNNALFITSPTEGYMLWWDNIKQYWNPPQVIPEIGLLSSVGTSMISHSTLRNVTNTLFTGLNDNGQNYTVVIRTPYDAAGTRWRLKNGSMTFVEGYIIGAPLITMRVYLDMNGCKGVLTHPVAPVFCVPPNNAPIGEGSFGSHGLGNDQFTLSSYFREVYPYKPFEYYFAAMELECSTLDQNWSLLSMGINHAPSNKNNSQLKSRNILIP